MSIRTSWRARTGMPARLTQAHSTSTIDQNTTPHGRHRTAVRAGVLAIAAALTVTLTPAAGAQEVPFHLRFHKSRYYDTDFHKSDITSSESEYFAHSVIR